jgi:hypothetical protein
MKKGTYYGGSTLIKAGQWTTIDPAESKHDNLKSTPKGRIKRSRKVDAKSRTSFLKRFVMRSLMGQTTEKLVADVDWLLAEVTQAGKLEAWARLQPDFERVVEESLDELKRRRLI